MEFARGFVIILLNPRIAKEAQNPMQQIHLSYSKMKG